MEVETTIKYVRQSPKKLRLVAGLVRGYPASKVVKVLSFTPKRAAKPLLKAVKTAISDAVNNFKLNDANLVVKTIDIGQGPSFKRYRPVARGMAHPYERKTSHIKVVLEEIPNQAIKGRGR